MVCQEHISQVRCAFVREEKLAHRDPALKQSHKNLKGLTAHQDLEIKNIRMNRASSQAAEQFLIK